MCICPHCGQPWQPKTEWNYSSWCITTQFGTVVLTGELQVKIFDILWRKQNIKGLTRDRIKDIIYADDIKGGPEGYWTIYQAIKLLRRAIASVGICIQAAQGRSREGYSLVFMTPEQAKSVVHK